MGVTTYTRQRDGSFKREGEAKERYVSVTIYKGGVWSEPLAPVRRTRIVDVIEENIANGSRNLPGDIYKLTGVASLMSDEDAERLRELGKRKREQGADDD